MAQPTRRLDDVAPVQAAMEERGEFWVRNPWRYPPDKNLSAFEPNRVYLNRGRLRFLEITFLSGAGSVADGRGALIADIDDDLQPDVIARNVGGGPVQVYLNRFPRSNRLMVTLTGTRSNRLGIGARLVAHVRGRRLVRELFPTNNYLAQQASRVRFGLGDAPAVTRLVISWPSGTVQDLGQIPANLHIHVVEGKGDYRVVQRG